MTSVIQELDHLREPLQGVRLVEAGAGSGKTYAIAALYVRLVAELGLEPQAILVTTFTTAAAGELKDRIRKRLRQARQWLEAGGPGESTDSGESGEPDPFLAGLADKLTDKALAVQRLTAALRDFDEAAIETIHGFCLRTLLDFAFESGTALDAELSTDQAGLVKAAMRDYWRERVYGASAPFLAYLGSAKFKPDVLRNLAHARLNHPEAELLSSDSGTSDEKAMEARLEQAFDRAASLWNQGGRTEAPGLLKGPAVNKQKIQSKSVDKCAAALDAIFAAGPHAAMNLPERFDNFTATKIAANPNTGHQAPRHDFFTASDELQATVEELKQAYAVKLARLKHEFALHLPGRLARLKRAENVLCFDDLVGDLDAALQAEGGDRLRREVRARYQAALIDEFQDTDPRQYRIFDTLFSREPHALFLIGDPKQAIYGFRGADVFAYLRAKRSGPQMSTLGFNWRSEPGLVRGVNALFTARDQPFVLNDLDFQPARPAKRDVDQLAVEGDDGPQLRIWKPGKAKENKGDLEKLMHQAVAREIVRLLNLGARGKAGIGQEPLAPGHMAVLVKSHVQAKAVQAELIARSVPCVISKCGNVFATRQAGELLRILTAMAEPGESAVISALVTQVLGVSPERAKSLRRDSREFEKWLELFTACGEAWDQGGLMAAAGQLLAETRARPRLLAMDQGERKLTDLLHLLELAHGREQETRSGPAEITAWLAATMAEARDGDRDAPEEHQLRLDKDAAAVKVVTIHASKGLEYPVVFAPYVIFGPKDAQEPRLYHDPDRDLAMVLDPSPDKDGPGRDLQRRESLAEALRLAYVALTRARNRCYTAWGAFESREKAALASALQYLLSPAKVAPDESVFQALMDEAKDMTPAEAEARLERLVQAHPVDVGILDLPEPGDISYEPPTVEVPELACREFKGRMDRSWRVSSFTALSSGLGHAPLGSDPGGLDEGAAPDPASVQEPEPHSLFAFPRGARPGIVLHSFMEHLDFRLAAQDLTGEPVLDLARKTLCEHGFDPEYAPALVRMARQVCGAELAHGVRLADVGPRDRLDEMGFTLPMAPISVGELAEVYARHEATLGADVAARVRDLAFQDQQGHLTGFMDLVFRAGERWHLVDWKSNHLGADPADYTREPLRRAMVAQCYFLQYHLYAAALDAYLSQRLIGYDYARHFGGATYVFLRGVDPDHPGCGLYHDLPDQAFLRDLAGLLAGKGGAGGAL